MDLPIQLNDIISTPKTCFIFSFIYAFFSAPLLRRYFFIPINNDKIFNSEKPITILNLYESNNIVSKYVEQSYIRTTRRSIQTHNKTEIFNRALTNSIRRQDVSKDVEDSNNMIAKHLFKYS